MNISVSSFAAGVVTTLVIASSGAYAATGGNFILGRSNSANATTTLTNSAGTALALNAKSGTPALKVNSGTKVANLNGDKLDGLDSTAFARAGMKTTVVYEKAFAEDLVWENPELPGEPDGIVDTFATEIGCDQGMILTGGGVNDATYTGRITKNGPTTDGTQWQVIVQTDNKTDETSSTVEAYAVCLNPKGA